MWWFCWFLATGTQALWAQGDPSGQYFHPYGGTPAYGDRFAVPQYSGMQAAGYPPGGNAWPDVSAYGPDIDRHYMHNGFWFNKVISGDSRYFATLEGLITSTGTLPQSPIGAPDVNIVTPEVLLNDAQHNQQFFEKVVLSGNGTPERDFTNTGAGTTNDVQIFPTATAGWLRQKLNSGGIRGTWGWWNPDDSGFQVQGWWQDSASTNYMASDFPLIINLNETNPSLPSFLTNVNFLDHLHPWFGLALPGPDRDGDGLPGVVVPYDVYVRFDHTASIYGGNLDWYFSPFYEKDYLKIRGVVGARLLQVNEFFSFQGADSGMGYTLQTNPDFDSTGTGSGSGQSTPSIPQLIIQSVDAEFASPSPSVDGQQGLIFSLLQSRSNGTFAGPEAGVRIDVGGDRFKFWLQSKFGLLAYNSQRKINGYNIGDHFDILSPTAPNPDGLPLDPQVDGVSINPTRAAGIQGTQFYESKTNTTVSPMFEQGVFVQAPLFSYVPVVRKISAFEKAEFQLGYTFLLLGGVYRPNDSIQWAQFPDFPTIQDQKSQFYTQNLSLGVHWNY